MAEQRIVRYRASWNHKDHFGVIDLQLQGGETAQLEISDPAAFGLMFQLLQRDSDPFLIDGTWISTGVEHPG